MCYNIHTLSYQTNNCFSIRHDHLAPNFSVMYSLGKIGLYTNINVIYFSFLFFLNGGKSSKFNELFS